MGGEAFATEPESSLVALLSPSMAGIHPWHLQQEFIQIQSPALMEQISQGINPLLPSPLPAQLQLHRQKGREEAGGEMMGIV